MEINEMRHALISKYKSRHFKLLDGYISKVKGMTSGKVKSEYELVVLGKKPVVKKKEVKKKFRKSKDYTEVDGF